MSRRCRSRWTTGSNSIAVRFEPSVSTGARTVVVTGGVIRRGTGAGGRESYLADEVDATATGDRHPRSGNPCHPAAGCAPVTSKKIAEAGIEPAQASFRATCSYQQERLRSALVSSKRSAANMPGAAGNHDQGARHRRSWIVPRAVWRGGVPRKDPTTGSRRSCERGNRTLEQGD